MKAKLTIWSTTSPKLEDLISGINDNFSNTRGALMVLACSKNHYDPDSLSRFVTTSKTQIFGAIFPGLILNNEVLEQGVIVINFSFEVDIYIQKELSIEKILPERFLTESSKPLENQENLIVLVDGLSKSTEKFIHRLYEYVGSDINAIGGGTGHHDLREDPSIFSNFGVMSGAALLIGLPFEYKQAVGHGWNILDGPFLTTTAKGQNIHSINYEPAFDFYKRVVEEKSGQKINKDNFYEIASLYPIGMYNLHEEIIVRDPICFDGNVITCVGEVYQNAMIHILEGIPEELINSTKQAAKKCLENSPNTSHQLVFHCLTRMHYHGTGFYKEVSALNAFREENQNLFGVLSLGEISNNESGGFVWLNKSVVIGKF